MTGYPPEDLLLRPGFLKAAERSLDLIARRDDWHRRADRRHPPRSRPLQRLRRARRPARSRRSTTSGSFRTTASSTRTATFSQAGSSCSFASARRLSGRRSARTSGSRGRRPPTSRCAAPTSSRTSRHRRSIWARGRSARRCSPFGPATTSAGSRSSTRSAARTSSSSTATRSSSTRTARVVARGPAFEEALLVVDIDPSTAVGHRLRDARRRSLVRGRRDLPSPQIVDRGRRARAAGARPLERARPQGRTARSPLSSRSSRRCGARSSSGSPTTSRRTAFARSCSASRAASTRR